jgi:hypothetical protein
LKWFASPSNVKNKEAYPLKKQITKIKTLGEIVCSKHNID